MTAPTPPTDTVIRCRRCGRVLTAETSREAGIGPSCEKKEDREVALYEASLERNRR